MDPHWKKMDFFKIYQIFFNNAELSKFFFLFSLNLDEPARDLGVNKMFFLSFWLIFCPLDPGSQNLADPDLNRSLKIQKMYKIYYEKGNLFHSKDRIFLLF